MIQDDPRQIKGAGFGLTGHWVGTEAVIAPSGQLAQGHGGSVTAGDVDDAGRRLFLVLSSWFLVAGCHLFDEEGDEVSGVEAIADLMTHSIEPDVLERTALAVTVDPISKDALIRATELACSGKHTAAVDPDGESKSFPIFESQRLGTEFGGTIERDGGGGGKRFGDATGGKS
jgi:hypothetical protein